MKILVFTYIYILPSVCNEVEHLTEKYCVKVLQFLRRDMNSYLVFSEEELWQQVIKACNMLIYCVN
jgi:3-deoxy-D-manno-octulosonic-acid transferase